MDAFKGRIGSVSALGTALARMAGLAAVLGSGQALAQNTYEFSTDSGQVLRNNVPVFDFEGVPIVAQPSSAGIRTWLILGDMRVPATYRVQFTGSTLAQVLVGGNLVVPAGASISADASNEEGGPGGVGAIGFALPSRPAQAGGLLGLSTHRELALVGSGGGSAEDRHTTQGTQALREAKR